MAASIARINTSEGGVPKRAVAEAEVTELGLAGDRQRDRQSHGGTERALCLFAIENIQAMQAQGHPIAPGTTGENITTQGLDWAAVTPGTRLRLGESVEVEITGYTAPCDNLTAFFSDGDYMRMSAERDPANSRVYARVLRGGLIRAGDPVAVLKPTG
jgi:MOSC domain-containing protein YiiM